MTESHEPRRSALGAALGERELDAALVTSLVNIRYLTGFTGSAAALLVRSDGSATLATDGRYQVQAGDEAPGLELLITRSGPRDLTEQAAGGGAGRVGFEDLELTVSAFRALPESVSWQPLGTTVTELRLVKDAGELQLLRKACAVTDQALAAVLPRLTSGVSERQVARWIDDLLRDASEGPGFDTIVASGPNGAIPHHQPSERRIEPGDLVTIDVGARLAGYHADMTRTVLVEGGAAEWQQEVYDVVRRSQAAGVDALRAGVSGREIDAVAREVVQDAGYGSAFVHGLGHGVGLQIHEAPYLGATSTDKLLAGVPVTIEPGVYLPGRGGVRIEDTVVVHSNHVETLTTTTRDLLVLG